MLRLALGVAALGAVTALAEDGTAGRFESDLFRLVNDLPHLLRGPLFVVMQAGSLSAVPVVVALALALRRVRLARDAALAGVSAWVLAKVVKGLVERPRPAGLLPDVDLHLPEPGGRGFPSGHVSVAAALTAVAWPYLTPRLRRVAVAGVLSVGVARVYAGLHLPWDVVGGAALGVAVGAAVHLLLGAPGGRPAASAVRRALERTGLAVTEITTPQLDARGSTPFVVQTADARTLFVKAIGRTQRDADVLYRFWRWTIYRQPADEFPFLTPKQSVQHESHLSMLAERAGVRTPSVVLDTVAADGNALLVQDYLDGRDLGRLDVEDVDDALLRDLWQQVARLHAARIAHRDLRLANVLVDTQRRAWLIDFGAAQASSDDFHLEQDVAELLAATAVVVGPERACHAACDGIGPDAVARALPLLQPFALTTQTRRQAAAQPGLLDRLREQAAATAGGTAPALVRLPRIRLRTIVLVVLTGIGLYALLPSVGELSGGVRALGTANWWWMLVALAASLASYVAAAVALTGATGRPLPFVPTVTGQLAASFANRFTPAGLGAIALNTRLLERSGLTRPAAAGAVVLAAAAGVVVHVAALVVLLLWLGAAQDGAVAALVGALPSWVVLVAATATLVAGAGALASPWGRRRLLPSLSQAWTGLRATLRRPRQAAALLLGSAGVTLAYAASLAASAEALDLGLSFPEVAVAYLAGAALASAVPTPSGLGAAEAALTAGLVAVGAVIGPAVAAVLVFRLVTFWLPIIPGAVAFRWLRRRHSL